MDVGFSCCGFRIHVPSRDVGVSVFGPSGTCISRGDVSNRIGKGLKSVKDNLPTTNNTPIRDQAWYLLSTLTQHMAIPDGTSALRDGIMALPIVDATPQEMVPESARKLRPSRWYFLTVEDTVLFRTLIQGRVIPQGNCRYAA